MAKRADGEGTVTKRSDGRWMVRISLGVDDSGKRIRKSVYASTQSEAIEKLDSLRRQAKLNLKSVTSKDSLAAYLESWLADDVAVNKAGKTFEEYDGAVRLFIVPFVGAIRLSNLSGEQLQAWQAKLKRQGFSGNQRLRSIRVLRNALNRAVKLRRIAANPCLALDIPKVVRRDVTPLEPAECHELFEACQKNRLGDAVVLAVMTGLRLREIFALDWSAVNVREGVLSVRGSLEEISRRTADAMGTGRLNEKAPKTKSSKRVVTLEPIAVDALNSRRAKAIAEGFDPEEVPIIFPNTLGRRLRGSAFNSTCWYPIRESLGLSHVRFHDLRHSHASLMLYAGVDLKVIQNRLGHSSFSTTADLYSHLMTDSQALASDKLSALMGTPEKLVGVRSGSQRTG